MKTITTIITGVLVASLSTTALVQAGTVDTSEVKRDWVGSQYECSIDTRDMSVSNSWKYLYNSYNEGCEVFEEYGFDIGAPLKPFMNIVDEICTTVGNLADKVNLFDETNYKE